MELTDNKPGQPFFFGDVNIAGDILSVGDVGKAGLGRLKTGEHDAETDGFVELGEDNAIDIEPVVPHDGLLQSRGGTGGGQAQVYLVGQGFFEQIGEPVGAIDVVLRKARRVDEDEVAVGVRADGAFHLGAGCHARERDADDVGVNPKLLDGGDSKDVGGDKADTMAEAECMAGSELRDGGGLADAGWADEGDD